MILYCGLMVHITDTRTQKVGSYTSAHITETVLAHDQHWDEHSSLSSPHLYQKLPLPNSSRQLNVSLWGTRLLWRWAPNGLISCLEVSV